MSNLKTIFVTLILAFLASSALVIAEPLEDVSSDSRCHVCGMFVSKYPNWLTQIHSGDGKIFFFDGVKDMMVLYFNPAKYKANAEALKDIWVKDYYTLKWLDGRKAYYVVGSDIHGPMGHEFIPFASRKAAQSFLKDHHGSAILAFADITLVKVESMRMGMKMKMKMK